MDLEFALVSKLVQTGSIETALARGIEQSHFEDEECRELFHTCVEHIKKYKVPPTLSAIKGMQGHKDFKFQVSEDALEYLLDKFIGLVKYRATVKSTRRMAKLTEHQDNWQNLDLEILEVARDLAQVVPSSQIARLSQVRQRIEEYERLKALGENPGIKMGIPTFDDLTMGMQPHEYISIVGWQGLGKSTLMQYMLFNAYMQGKTPMLISLEMEADALFRKWDTMATNMSYKAMKAMELGKGDMNKWEAWGEKAENASADRDIIVIDNIGRCTVDKVFAETVRHNPDLVAVDYISLMESPNNIGATWEKVTYCTKGLKQNARTLKTPVIGLAQTNKEDGGQGAKLDNIAYSRSVGQDSDLVLGLFRKDEWEEQMEVRLLKNRDGRQGKVKMKWNPERMEFHEIDLFERPTTATV